MSMPFIENGIESTEIEVTEEQYGKLFSSDWSASFVDGQLTFIANTVLQEAQAAIQQKKDELQDIKKKINDGTSTNEDILKALKLLINDY